MAVWGPKQTFGLWSTVQGAVADGWNLEGVRRELRRADLFTDAATLSHLYSRAVAGDSTARAEADYRSRVDPDTYSARRPGAGLITDLPTGFRSAGRYRQVIRVLGTHVATGADASQVVAVTFDRLLSRGEALDEAMEAVRRGLGRYQIDVADAEYITTWRRA